VQSSTVTVIGHRNRLYRRAVLDETFNGPARGRDRQVVFVLLVFPFGEGITGKDRRAPTQALRSDPG